MEQTNREQVEQKITITKEWLRWWIALGVVGILGIFLILHGKIEAAKEEKEAYERGYRDGTSEEKIKSLEDIVFNHGIYRKLETETQNE